MRTSMLTVSSCTCTAVQMYAFTPKLVTSVCDAAWKQLIRSPNRTCRFNTRIAARYSGCAGAYRERLILLDEYSATHGIPQSMVHELKGHLQLHFSSAEMSDEAVLAVYPTTVRR